MSVPLRNIVSQKCCLIRPKSATRTRLSPNLGFDGQPPPPRSGTGPGIHHLPEGLHGDGDRLLVVQHFKEKKRARQPAPPPRSLPPSLPPVSTHSFVLIGTPTTAPLCSADANPSPVKNFFKVACPLVEGFHSDDGHGLLLRRANKVDRKAISTSAIPHLSMAALLVTTVSTFSIPCRSGRLPPLRLLSQCCASRDTPLSCP